MSFRRHLQVAAILAIPALTLQAANEVDYRAEIEAWRVNREEGAEGRRWLADRGGPFLSQERGKQFRRGSLERHRGYRQALRRLSLGSSS